jgi:hypothetical protein
MILKQRRAMFCGGGLLAIAAIAAGCAGGSSEPELTTSSLGKAAYVKKVNAICLKWTHGTLEEMQRIGTEPIASTSPGKAMTKVWAPGLLEEAEQVRAVGAPSGDAAEVEAYLVALGKAAEEVEAHEPPDIFRLQKLLEPINRPAGSYGLENCEF